MDAIFTFSLVFLRKNRTSRVGRQYCLLFVFNFVVCLLLRLMAEVIGSLKTFCFICIVGRASSYFFLNDYSNYFDKRFLKSFLSVPHLVDNSVKNLV